MSITITRPLMTLLDGNGLPVPGVSKSTSEVEAMEKASLLPDGTYYLQRPDATIEVLQDPPITEPVPEPEPEPPTVPGYDLISAPVILS